MQNIIMDKKEHLINKYIMPLRDMVSIGMIFCALFVSIFYLLVNLNTQDSHLKWSPRYHEMDGNWQVELSDGSTLEQQNLPIWVEIPPNETVTLSHIIPDDLQINSSIVTRNYHNDLSVYVDQDEIYVFPERTTFASRSIITDDWNLIRFSTHHASRDLHLKFTSGSTGFKGTIEAPLFGEDNAIIGYLRSKYSVPFILSVLLMVLGVFMLIVASVYTKKIVERDQVLIGLVFVAVGIWFADRSKMPILTVGSNVKFFLAFNCLSFVSLLLFLYISIRFKDVHQKLSLILLAIDSLVLVTLFILVASNLYPVHYIIKYIYLSILVACVYLTFLLWNAAHGSGRVYLNRVELNATKMEFIAAIVTIIGSVASILYDAIASNNWSTSHRDWSGVGIIQMVAINIFALAQLIIVIYKGYHGSLEREIINKKLHDSQLELMMGQIQPHFMFNTLSSIRTLVKIDPDLAYKMLYDFSNYLRANVDNITNLDGIIFSAEVDHIKSYVGIEEVRFGDRLKVEYDIRETNFVVPPLSIQPLVENAIKHGVCKRTEGGTVWLKSYSDDHNYIVEVSDDGVGFDPNRIRAVIESDLEGSENPKTRETIKQTIHMTSVRDRSGKLIELENLASMEHIADLSGNGSEAHVSSGMKNIILRLKEITNANLEIDSQVDKGTTIKVFFPKDYNDNM